ncbi:helix-turn-helix domain-containing protein [Mucilaginibacter ginsenosidivorans]|uniref:Helix-turn-helix transcriptional regulator n=1 Tax=Mucilaginibacter ginsenosidivorans TaxID=398053 RepID=A0A5B8US70_9SPHI|nr:AraC family transcriptional regulator [Mucilaginibacter ginsenosidivorans]QEC61585.1 helix-turn-helix transcriptional regulator [Mucilaginibacter ginsenosidivorans]
MQSNYKKIDLLGKPFLQKVVVKPPFAYDFPVEERACFLYVLQGEMRFKFEDDQTDIPVNHSLLLNCLDSGKQIRNTGDASAGEVVIVTFHPEILKKIYERELPAIIQPGRSVSNQSHGKISNDYLIQKYIEGLLFYFENPALVNEEIMILKLKEIILLLSQTQQAETVQVILSQLFSPAKFSFKQVIEAHLFAQINIEELAQKTNLSVSSFKREFAKLYNDTPANYIKNKKLEKAAELLLAFDNRIADVAYQCGFNDLANFTKSFHDKYHVSPTHYRLNQIAK